MRVRFIYSCLVALLLTLRAWAGDTYAASSALAEGRWVRISVEKNGIYKLTYAELRSMGFEDPAKVSVHGYGGWPLAEESLH